MVQVRCSVHLLLMLAAIPSSLCFSPAPQHQVSLRSNVARATCTGHPAAGLVLVPGHRRSSVSLAANRVPAFGDVHPGHHELEESLSSDATSKKNWEFLALQWALRDDIYPKDFLGSFQQEDHFAEEREIWRESFQQDPSFWTNLHSCVGSGCHGEGQQALWDAFAEERTLFEMQNELSMQ
ncbi:hypothetical protein GUITHDRAFT_153213 [Guillardia theta CCMP2712]|uniref:Uncharacterized protein n=1 Tax=Guillardia theta (strain CCMP2712) TaxID=905079 RepID=L1J5H3_GUITC|nr:hypothetical protein GUITHDRAFT_153213 [Guillardia theta CCMP2712]EKX43597.1 hypothetical protein GUITHDRAFT_153213 [Guillardia theta CCMP2712]|eukprot:XP_005830577.1 hypothetical protein GUITHDRAFT_153213 [Guillardia theta CCMP2712]